MMRAADKRRYYFSIEMYGKIMDALDELHFGSGRSLDYYKRNVENAWAVYFKLYRETDELLKKAEDPNDFSLYPLYRNLGQDEKDFLFDTEEEAMKEYESHIYESLANKMYDL